MSMKEDIFFMLAGGAEYECEYEGRQSACLLLVRSMCVSMSCWGGV